MLKENVKNKCNKALDIIKVAVTSKWGADKTTLFHMYRCLDCIIYGSVRTSYLKALDQEFRLCLGALRAAPVDSLYVEANEPPLDLRRLKLKLQANIENLAFDCLSSTV